MMKSYALVLLAACGSSPRSDIEPTLRFADLSDAEITRLVGAASGAEGREAAQALYSFSSTTSAYVETCPAIAINGPIVSVTGGCTTKTKIGVEGAGTATNSGWGDVEVDHSADTTYELTALVLVQSGVRRSYDGVVVRGGRHEDMDVIVSVGDTSIRSDLYLDDCTHDGCGTSGGVELIAVGGARVTGTTRIENETPTERYTLRGADTVTATIKNECTRWRLEGTDRTFTSSSCSP